MTAIRPVATLQVKGYNEVLEPHRNRGYLDPA
jgi:hypothetical protein